MRKIIIAAIEAIFDGDMLLIDCNKFPIDSPIYLMFCINTNSVSVIFPLTETELYPLVLFLAYNFVIVNYLLRDINRQSVIFFYNKKDSLIRSLFFGIKYLLF